MYKHLKTKFSKLYETYLNTNNVFKIIKGVGNMN